MADRSEEVRTEPKPCPLCESTTLLARDYRSGSRGWRSCYNCPQCGFIIEDKPRDFPSVLSAMDAPQIVAPGQKLEVGIWVRNPYGDRDLGGALHLSPNLTGHRLLPDRPVHRFRLAPHAKQKIVVRLLPTGERVTAHAYTLRALALADGLWHWRSHRLLVTEPPGQPVGRVDGVKP